METSFIPRRAPLPSICSSESVNFRNTSDNDEENSYFNKEFREKYTSGKTRTHGMSIRQKKAESAELESDEETTTQPKTRKRDLRKFVPVEELSNEEGEEEEEDEENDLDRDISYNNCIYCTYGILVNTGLDNDQDEIPEFEKTIRVFIQRTVMKVSLGFLLSEIRKLTQNEIVPFLRDKGHHNLPPITNEMIKTHFSDHFIEPFLATKFHIMELKEIQTAMKKKLFSSIKNGDLDVDKQHFDIYTRIEDMILKLCKQDPTKHIGFDENFAASTNLRVRSLLTQQGYSGKKQKKDG